MKKNNILIIGGTGFIGYHLAIATLKLGWKVTSISYSKPKKIRKIKNVKYILCDITKKNLLKKKIQKDYEFVVNLGGHVNHSNKVKTYNSHFIGCKNIAEIFLKKNIKSFVQIGSSAEYGTLNSPHYEKFTCSPKSVYGKAKLLATKHLMKLYKKYKFPVSVIRVYQAYGPRQDFNRFVPIVIKGCLTRKFFPCSHGNQFRDFLYIEDVISSIIKCLKLEKSNGEIFNIGSGKPKQIKKIINDLVKISNGGLPQFGEIKLRADETLSIYPNIKKAKKILDWTPKVPFDKGLKKTINFYK